MRPGPIMILPLLGVLSAALPLSTASGAEAHGRLTVVEENDYFASDRDGHYTQGLRFSYLTARLDGASQQPFDRLGERLPIFAPQSEQNRRFEFLLGQSVFTPDDISRVRPARRDRPYAGWLHGGVSLLQESGGNRLEALELDLGMVGPASLARQTQNDWHQFIGIGEARGWQYQLRNEPGLVLSYERKWRWGMPLGGGLTTDIVPEVGGSLGNVLSYAQTGFLVRAGWNLDADYGPARIRPGPSGTGWFDAARLDGNSGGYLFLGVQGRAIGRNVFLDGNTFVDGPRIGKKPLVADLVGGVSLYWSDAVRFDFVVTQRTEEYRGQAGQDRFGGINLSFRFW